MDYQQDYQDYGYQYEPESTWRRNRILWIIVIVLLAALVACACCICLAAGVLLYLNIDNIAISPEPLPTATPASELLPTPTVPAAPTSTPTPGMPPQPVIVAPPEAIVGQEVTFDGSQAQPGSYPITNYYWDFGDGKTAEGPVVTHAYGQAATYRVTHTVVDESGASIATTAEIVVREEEAPPPEPTTDPAGGLLGPTWKWTQLIEEGPSAVPDPESYTLTFYEDRSLDVVADCNEGSGTYLVDDNQLRLDLGTLSLVACGPDSLSDQYLEILGKVASFERDGDRLLLNLDQGAGQAVFLP